MLSLKLCVDVAATARSMGCSSAARYPTELGLSAYYSPKILLSSDATFTVIGYFVSSEKTKIQELIFPNPITISDTATLISI